MADEKKLRSVARALFTKTSKEFECLLKSELQDATSLAVSWALLKEKFECLKKADSEVWEKLIQQEIEEDALIAEVSKTDEYATVYLRLEQLYNKHMVTTNETESLNSVITRSEESRKFKLPIIEFKKFGGDVRDWLTFWSQFQKIHTDGAIPSEDKFQYLIQTTVVGSRARAVVESFPPTRENYQKAIDSLHARFGRDELLVEVYVRELLKLVLQNSLSKEKYNLSTLYDKIEMQLRALESLGVTSDKCAAMLFPLVESCLPEELLRAWQRNSRTSENEEENSDRLQDVMKFLKREVESEERIALAIEGFGISAEENRGRKQKGRSQDSPVPTATGLINSEKSGCQFCSNRSHASTDCFSAQKMSLEEKRRALSKQKSCFLCLKQGHQSPKCRERLRCIVCTERHVPIMCPNLPTGKNKVNKSESTDANKETPSVTAPAVKISLASQGQVPVFLQTLRVLLRSDTKEREVRAIIDGGSQQSYVLKSTLQSMGYSVKRNETLIHELFGGTTSQPEQHKCYDIQVASLDGDFMCRMEVLDKAIICNDIPPISEGKWQQELHKLGIELTDMSGSEPIELLIGADESGQLFTGQKHSLSSGLTAFETSLGWTVIGKVKKEVKSYNTAKTYISLLNKEMTMTELWNLETIGIKDPIEQKTRQQAEMVVREHFKQTVSRDEEQRYEVCLPWVEDHPPLPRNESLSLNRLKKTVVKLKGNGYYKEYNHVLETWLEEGIIEQVPSEDLSKTAHYLPHRGVVKMSSSTTKLRPVFDASAHKSNTPALNDCLETGENLIELIPQILLKFRMFEYGISADICKAFLQIGIQQKDRDCLRFLWVKEDGEIIHLRHRRVVFGLCASPFLLGITIKHHLEEMKYLENDPDKKKIIDILMKSFYVDNCLTSMSSQAEAHNFQQMSSQIMSAGKFDLRCWEITQREQEGSCVTPVLGMLWDRNHDILTINHIQIHEDIDKISKREILSIAQRIFDPVGYLSPALLTPKLLLQRLWNLKVNWDEEVPEDIRSEFLKWKTEIIFLEKIQIPRWIRGAPGEEKQWSLHTFVDASKDAYAAAVFIRVAGRGTTYVNLLLAKTRVSPLRKLTIPRLELLAATIGARLYDNVKRALEIENIESYFWSDSSTVLSWIKCEEQWATFVWNRVVEIRTLTNKEDWNHVPGVQNPADLLSRGCSPKYLLSSKWWEGPPWLYMEKENWPTAAVTPNKAEINAERKKITVSMTTVNLEESTRFYAYFSCYNKQVRMIAWMKRYLNNINIHCDKKSGELTSMEFHAAELSLIRLIQQEVFKGNDDCLKTLDTFLDKDDIIRLKSRVSRREDYNDFCFPILLPAKHPIVERLIREQHVQHCHAGVQTLMVILRERFWIMGGRKPVKGVIRKCIQCRRQTAQAARVNTPALPMNRVNDANLFEVTGVDFAGPVYLKTGKKAWICLYTCAVYRAVHLELVTSLSTHCFLQSFRRFIARRGRPRAVYSDNGTNFVGAKSAFDRVDYTSIQQYCAIRQIEWYFNPPSAAWWGGWWERLIRLLKDLLRRVLGRACLNAEEFATILCECESVINNRPITYASNDPKDLRPITPSMFMRELRGEETLDFDFAEDVTFSERVRYLKKVRDDLRARFRGEYLGLLKQNVNRKNNTPINLNDLVFIGNDMNKRLDWPLGRVIELLPGKDGTTRVVRVQTAKGVLLRPVQRLYPLECSTAEVMIQRPAGEKVMRKELTNEDEACSAASTHASASIGGDKCSESEGDSVSVPVVYTTRKGRPVNVPHRYKST